MRVERSGMLSLTVEFDGEDELRAEQRGNLAVGGLLLRTQETLPALEQVEVRLRLPGRAETAVKATVVATPPGALALQVQGHGDAIVAALLAAPAAPPPPGTPAEPTAGEGPDEREAGTLWDRVRAMTPPERMLLAPKADRLTRALLLQDNDKMVLFALLKNPKLGVDEVVRIANSSALGLQAAELILKTPLWNTNLEVRLALIHNPKLPLPLALRILPGLPEAEARVIAKGAATSAALKTAALRRLVNG